MRVAILFCFLSLTAVLAQESPTPTPIGSPSPSPSPIRSVPLRFALPPFAGTISLGIYDRNGKLVRVLHREDTIADFTTGQDALETTWDGSDDNGGPLPGGKYHARGYIVGGLKVEGIDYFFNDWVTDENSPHLRSLGQLWMKNRELELQATAVGNETLCFVCDQATGAVLRQSPGKFGVHCDALSAVPNIFSPRDCAAGKDGTIWYIDQPQSDGPGEVKQLDRNHELLRRLSYSATDPQPQSIEASSGEEKIFLTERNDQLQRFRALALVRTTNETPGESVSDWKAVFEKKIVSHEHFALENDRPVANPTKPQSVPDKVIQKLRPNPLRNDRPGKVELAIGIDEDGSFLKTGDGLPLRTISDTPHLTRTLFARPDDSTLDVFEDDGAVVEQFRVSNLGEMLAFDCGEFELK